MCDQGLIAMPDTLKVLKKLNEFAPENGKIKSYICKTYLEYGYPDMALDYYHGVKESLPANEMYGLLADLFNHVIGGEDEELVKLLLGELEKYCKEKSRPPTYMATLMRFYARYAAFVLDKKKEPKRAAQLVMEYINWFNTAMKGIEDHEYFKRVGGDKEAYKRYVIKIVMESSRFQLYEVHGRALAALKQNPEGDLGEIMKYAKAMMELEFADDDYRGCYGYYQASRGHTHIAAIYRAMGKKKMAEEHSKKATELRKKYYEKRQEIKKLRDSKKK